MKSISTFAIAVSLVVGGAVVGAPALAQKKGEQAAAEAPKMKLSKQETAAIIPLQTAVRDKNYAQAATLLPAAQAAAKSPDARYVVGGLQYQMALGNNDTAGQAAALEAMIATGRADQSSLTQFYKALGSIYTNLKQPDRAMAAYQKLSELQPNSVEATLAMAEATAGTNKAQAIELIQKAIATQKASGQAVPENWYRRALRFAIEANLAQQQAQISRDLLNAYPTPENWRNALTIYRQGANLDKQGETDVLRFMRAAKAMKGDADYFKLANNLNDLGFPGESKAVIDEGVQSRAIDGNKDYFRQLSTLVGGRVSADRTSLPGLKSKALAGANGKQALTTADAFYGYGDYASAIELYRAAIQKGGVDNNVANTRLGAALALAGRRAEAEAAFKAVTGPRQALANYWLLWLSQRG
jgi:tetratricopeptide (TPR) repeat protein